MPIPADQKISRFLPDPVQCGLVDEFDPNQSQVRRIAADDSLELRPDFLLEVIANRAPEAIDYFGDKADGRDVIYADALDTLRVPLGVVRLMGGLSISRKRNIERMVHGRAKLLSNALILATVDNYSSLFDVSFRPKSLAGYKALRQTIAIVGHAHTGENGGIELRKNGNPYWTHPDMTGEFIDEANQESHQNVPLAEAGAEQLAAGGHDADENGREPDSSHWATLPTLISPLCLRYVAERTGAADPFALALADQLLTRTRGIDDTRMDYKRGYIPNGMKNLYLQPTPKTLSLILASRRVVKVKKADQTANTNDPRHPLQRRINEDYVDTDRQYRTFFEQDASMLAYFDALDAKRVSDRDRFLATIADVDHVMIAGRAEQLFYADLPRVA